MIGSSNNLTEVVLPKDPGLLQIARPDLRAGPEPDRRAWIPVLDPDPGTPPEPAIEDGPRGKTEETF